MSNDKLILEMVASKLHVVPFCKPDKFYELAKDIIDIVNTRTPDTRIGIAIRLLRMMGTEACTVEKMGLPIDHGVIMADILEIKSILEGTQ